MAAATSSTRRKIKTASSGTVTVRGVATLGEAAIKMINEEGHLRVEVGDNLSNGFEE
jgi:hypothetical protein